jgi:predicted Fe-S protein YdhL (DUF1289 family)
MITASDYPSPCNKNCILDQATRLCEGCLRTIEEIIRWQFYSDEEKRKVLLNVAGRREKSLQGNNHQ